MSPLRAIFLPRMRHRAPCAVSVRCLLAIRGGGRPLGAPRHPPLPAGSHGIGRPGARVVGLLRRGAGLARIAGAPGAYMARPVIHRGDAQAPGKARERAPERVSTKGPERLRHIPASHPRTTADRHRTLAACVRGPCSIFETCSAARPSFAGHEIWRASSNRSPLKRTPEKRSGTSQESLCLGGDNPTRSPQWA